MDRVEAGHQEVARGEEVPVGNDLLVVVHLGLDVDHIAREMVDPILDLLRRELVGREVGPEGLELDAELPPGIDRLDFHGVRAFLGRLLAELLEFLLLLIGELAAGDDLVELAVENVLELPAPVVQELELVLGDPAEKDVVVGTCSLYSTPLIPGRPREANV